MIGIVEPSYEVSNGEVLLRRSGRQGLQICVYGYGNGCVIAEKVATLSQSSLDGSTSEVRSCATALTASRYHFVRKSRPVAINEDLDEIVVSLDKKGA